MKSAAKALFLVAGLSAAITLVYLLSGGWNALIALVIGGPATLIFLVVGLLLWFASGTKVPGDPRLKLGVLLLVLSAATWFYVFAYLGEGAFFIPYFPQIFGACSLIAGFVMTISGIIRMRKQKVTPEN